MLLKSYSNCVGFGNKLIQILRVGLHFGQIILLRFELRLIWVTGILSCGADVVSVEAGDNHDSLVRDRWSHITEGTKGATEKRSMRCSGTHVNFCGTQCCTNSANFELSRQWKTRLCHCDIMYWETQVCFLGLWSLFCQQMLYVPMAGKMKQLTPKQIHNPGNWKEEKHFFLFSLAQCSSTSLRELSPQITRMKSFLTAPINRVTIVERTVTFCPPIRLHFDTNLFVQLSSCTL